MHFAIPTSLGAAMAISMLVVMHDAIMSGTASTLFGAIAFAAVHVAVVLPVVALAFFVPSIRRFVKIHRPNARHVLFMALGMVGAAGSAHVIMHGMA